MGTERRRCLACWGKDCPVDWKDEQDFLGKVTEMGILRGW